MIIDSPILTIEAVLAAPVTTNELPISVSFTQGIRPTPDGIIFLSRAITTGTSDVTILSIPPNKEKRLVTFLSVCNLDTVPATVTLKYDDGTTETCLTIVTLDVGDTLQYTNDEGFRVISSDGGVKTNPGLIAHTDTTGQTTDDHHNQVHSDADHSDEHPVETLDKSAVDQVVDNTTTETSILSYTIAANKLGTNNLLNVLIVGRMDNTPGAETLTIRVKYGSTTVVTDIIPNPANSSTLPFNIEISLIANNGTSAQAVQMKVIEEGEAVAVSFGTAAEDSTTALTFEVTVEHSTAGVGITYTKGYTFSQLQR